MDTPTADAAILACPACHARNRVPVARLDGAPKCGRCAAPLFPADPFELDPRSLDRHLKADSIALLVDFWAPWCGPCLSMAPMFAAAAARIGTAVRLAKLDIQAHPAIGERFAIRGIPLMILFAGGREVDRSAGVMDADAIVRWLSGRLPG